MNQDEAIVTLIKEWKAGHAITAIEMLKVAFRPLIDAAVKQYDGNGLRSDDVRALAEKLVERAIDTYDDSTIAPTEWVLSHLKDLEAEVAERRIKINQERATPSASKG